jgi:CBS domain-containing protein
VITVPPGMKVRDVARTMLDHDVRAVPVVGQAGELLGIITETDLLVRDANLRFPIYLTVLDALLPIGGDRNLDDEIRRVLAVTAEQIMSTDVHTASPDDELGTVAHTMLVRHMHAVPVMERGQIVGMLFPSDVVRLIAEAGGG